MSFTLPQGSYRFRADLNGTQFWSSESNLCTLPGCEGEGITVTVTKPVTVTVQSSYEVPYPDMTVYVFDGTTYTGYNATTNASGQATFTLPQGSYRFRADLRGAQYWSSSENECMVPGNCASPNYATVIIEIPDTLSYSGERINYSYDRLSRLTGTSYAKGDWYVYTYDSVGNRLTQESMVGGQSSMVNYNYDIANRLTDVNGVPYNWDANGNLLNDGVNDYTYDTANRLTSVLGPSSSVQYAYNGLGDRLSQTVDGIPTNYLLDINTGLTQVLSDGTNSYTYGLGRISQQSGTMPEYFLGDALGSVRQLTNQAGAITYSAAYDPYGVVTQASGASVSSYGYTGEMQDSNTNLVYLRARYYNPYQGRFFQQDSWEGDPNTPLTFNPYQYSNNNPIRYTDPSGNCAFAVIDTILCAMALSGVAGGILGGVFAGTVATFTYEFALTGECPCTDVTKILVYPRSQFIGRATLIGVGVGAFLGAVAGIGALPAAGVAIFGAITTIPEIKNSYSRLKMSNYQDKCAWVDLVANSIGLGASAYLGIKALQTGLTTGKWIGTWVNAPPVQSELPGGPGNEAFLSMWKGNPKYAQTLAELHARGRTVYTAASWEDVGMSTVDGLDLSTFPKAFPEAMNSASRIEFDITNLSTSRAWVEGNIPASRLQEGNITSYEYYQIMTHPEWLAKTTFLNWEGGVLKWFTAFSSGELSSIVPSLK